MMSKTIFINRYDDETKAVDALKFGNKLLNGSSSYLYIEKKSTISSDGVISPPSFTILLTETGSVESETALMKKVIVAMIGAGDTP